MTRVHRLFRRLVVGLALLLLIWQGWYFGWVVWWKYVDPGQTAFMRHRLAELRSKKPAATLRHQVQGGRLAARLFGKTYVITTQELERYRATSLGKPGRPSHRSSSQSRR